MAAKQCSKCRKGFACTNETSGCWCEHLYIEPWQLKVLREAYDSCLCPTCLQEYACGEPQNTCGLKEKE